MSDDATGDTLTIDDVMRARAYLAENLDRESEIYFSAPLKIMNLGEFRLQCILEKMHGKRWTKRRFRRARGKIEEQWRRDPELYAHCQVSSLPLDQGLTSGKGAPIT